MTEFNYCVWHSFVPGQIIITISMLDCDQWKLCVLVASLVCRYAILWVQGDRPLEIRMVFMPQEMSCYVAILLDIRQINGSLIDTLSACHSKYLQVPKQTEKRNLTWHIDLEGMQRLTIGDQCMDMRWDVRWHEGQEKNSSVMVMMAPNKSPLLL